MQLGYGYEQLPEPYQGYFRVAIRFAHKALLDEREDLLHDIIMALSRVGKALAAKGDQFSEIAQIRTAEHVKDTYWYKHYSYYHGLDCTHCSNAQRARCRKNWASADYSFCDCGKVVTLESINQPVTDSEGDITELGELIADDHAIDLDEWLDAKTFLIGAPIRLKTIIMKRNRGTEMTAAERKYLSKLRKRYQQKIPNFFELGGNVLANP